MRRSLAGRQSSRLSAYHQGLHERAKARARLMQEMFDCGLSHAEIARRFGVSQARVTNILRKYREA